MSKKTCFCIICDNSSSDVKGRTSYIQVVMIYLHLPEHFKVRWQTHQLTLEGLTNIKDISQLLKNTNSISEWIEMDSSMIYRWVACFLYIVAEGQMKSWYESRSVPNSVQYRKVAGQGWQCNGFYSNSVWNWQFSSFTKPTCTRGKSKMLKFLSLTKNFFGFSCFCHSKLQHDNVT